MPTTEQQISHLETLLAELRRRYSGGDKSVEQQIRSNSVKLEQLKLDNGYKNEQQTVTTIATAVIKRVTRRCCR